MPIIKLNEVELNNIKYPITGLVKPILASVFAPKQVIGDYTKDSDPDISKWIISDQRGGILVEEMDEAVHANRAYWSNCQLGFKGHIVLPTLVTDCGSGELSDKQHVEIFQFDGEIYASFDEFLRVFDNTNTDFNDAVKTLAGNPTDAEKCINILFIACDSLGYYYNPKLFIPDRLIDGGLETWTDANTLTNWTKTGTGTLTQEDLEIQEGLYSAKLVSGAGSGDTFEVYQDISWNSDFAPRKFKVTAKVKASHTTYVDLRIDDGEGITGTNPTGTSWETIECERTLDADATRLRITMRVKESSGARTAYFDDLQFSFTETTDPWCYRDHIEAKFFVEWDAKAFKLDAENQLAYSTDGFTWTNNGKLNLDDDDVNEVFVHRDATGNPIIYAATKKGLYAHDYANAKWIQTELMLPDHNNAGKGAVRWRDACFISAGLDVHKYTVAETATIIPVGLDRDDGLPAKYDGEIVKFIKGYNDMFALVDSSQVSGEGFSGVYAYDAKGWQCKWNASGADNDKAMHTGIVSSAYAYYLWFDHNGKVYRMPLQRGIRNPMKIPTSTYGTTGIHLTPWFDAAWAGDKLALSLVVFCKDTTASDYVLVQYRIDHSDTDFDTGWDTLGTIYAAGDGVETEYTFGSDLGTLFKAIQFRLVLVRGSTTTLTPDVLYMMLKYKRVIPPTWGWRFTIDCTEEHDGLSAQQLLDAVITAAQVKTLVPFVYKDTTYYVEIKSVEGERLTGEGDKGTYNVLVKKL